jgi:trk system potassium uptake protein TrkA
MNIVIMGCGRVGAQLAAMLDEEGHKVTVIDRESYSFRRLPSNFRGMALVGDGTDEDTIRRAGIEEADAFVAVTQGDNRNAMASQIAKHIFNVPTVACRVYDPLRAEMYHALGLETTSPTMVGANLLKDLIMGQGG